MAAVHQGAGGILPGFRAAYVFGRIYAGAFAPTAAACQADQAGREMATNL